MNILFSILLVLLSTTVMAQYKTGSYKGVDSRTGQICIFTIKEVNYKNNSTLPLNLNLVIEISEKNYIFSHLPVISEKERTIEVETNRLTTIIPYSQGAKMFRLYFDHTVPVKMVYVNDNYYNPNRRKIRSCINLKLI